MTCQVKKEAVTCSSGRDTSLGLMHTQTHIHTITHTENIQRIHKVHTHYTQCTEYMLT